MLRGGGLWRGLVRCWGGGGGGGDCGRGKSGELGDERLRLLVCSMRVYQHGADGTLALALTPCVLQRACRSLRESEASEATSMALMVENNGFSAVLLLQGLQIRVKTRARLDFGE